MLVNNYSVSLNGSTDGFSIPDHADLKPTGSFTVGGWGKTSTSAYQKIFCSYNNSGTEKGIILDFMTSGYTRVLFGYGAGIIEAKSQTTGSTFYDGLWHFVVGTWDGSNLKLYVDGFLITTTSGGGNIPTYDATNYVGVGYFNAASPSNFFTGNIDQVFLVNGTAWTQDQIQTYMFADISNVGNLKLYCKFENNSTDSSPDGHVLSAVGSPTYSQDIPHGKNISIPSVADCYMVTDAATTNTGTQTAISVGKVSGVSSTRRTLLKFQLANVYLPINSATIRLYDEGAYTSTNSGYISVYRVKRAWTETGATWNTYDGSNNWTTAGCADTTNDREATSLGTLYVPTPPVAGYVDIPLTASLVEEMRNGAFTNNGFLLKTDSENDDFHTYSTREGSNPPLLLLSFAEPSVSRGVTIRPRAFAPGLAR